MKEFSPIYNKLLDKIVKIDEALGFHASPYDFDTFNVKYIGKGEGAQAHGWGLYFALSNETAKNYYYAFKMHNEAIKKILYNGKSYSPTSLQGMLLINLLKGKRQFLKAIREVLDETNWVEEHKELVPKLNKLLKVADKIDVKRIKYHQDKVDFLKGQMYTVEIPELDCFIEELVDLDGQSDYVQNCLNGVDLPKDWNNMPSKETAEKLYDLGIKGIKYNGYKDGDCVVVFNDKDVKISKKRNDYSNKSDVEMNDNYLEKRYLEGDKNIELSDIKNPSEQVQLKAVKENGFNIQYIENPSEQVQLKAVKEDGDAIQFIKNPSERVQLKAVKENGYAIEFIENPTEKVQLEAVKGLIDVIRFIKNPSEHVQLVVVKRDGYAIEYINKPSEKVQLEAVRQNGWAIQFIKNSSEQVQLQAVRQNGRAIQFIKNSSEQVQLQAVRQNGISIRYIKKPSEQVQLEAVKEYRHAIEYIKKPTTKVKALNKELWG